MGHIFQLGRKYADALELKVLDVNGKLVTVTMGSYGVGVSRAVAAIAENSHDDRGLIWPREISPADVHIVIAGKGPEMAEAAEDLARALDGVGVRVMLDDRNASVGVKLTDAELIGVPTIVVVGRGWRPGWWNCGTGHRRQARRDLTGRGGRRGRHAGADRAPAGGVRLTPAAGTTGRRRRNGPRVAATGPGVATTSRRWRSKRVAGRACVTAGRGTAGSPGDAPTTCFHVASRTAASDSPVSAKPRSSGVVGRSDDHAPGRGGVRFDVLGQFAGAEPASVTGTET